MSTRRRSHRLHRQPGARSARAGVPVRGPGDWAEKERSGEGPGLRTREGVRCREQGRHGPAQGNGRVRKVGVLDDRGARGPAAQGSIFYQGGRSARPGEPGWSGCQAAAGLPGRAARGRGRGRCQAEVRRWLGTAARICTRRPRCRAAAAVAAPGTAPDGTANGSAELAAAPGSAAASGTTSAPDTAARRLPPVPPSPVSQPAEPRPQDDPGAPRVPGPSRTPATPADFRGPGGGQPRPSAPRPGAPGGASGQRSGGPAGRQDQGTRPSGPRPQGPGAPRPGAPRPAAPGPRQGAPRPGPRPGNNPFSSTATGMGSAPPARPQGPGAPGQGGRPGPSGGPGGFSGPRPGGRGPGRSQGSGTTRGRPASRWVRGSASQAVPGRAR